MGQSKFYSYDGSVHTLRCDLREYIFDDFNLLQGEQTYAGTNERFTEIWWFYCSASSKYNDRYVVYNYSEDIWYYGTIARSAWLDTGMLTYPLGATYVNNIVNHEDGLDDASGLNPVAIDSYITSSETAIEEGDDFVFIRRMLPDLTFRGSTNSSPVANLSIIPLKNSGSGYTNPPSVGSVDNADVTRTATVPIEAFTDQVFIRVRGRQFVFKIENNQLGSAWQLGKTRVDIQVDGKRG